MKKLFLVLFTFSLALTMNAEDYYSELSSADLFQDEKVQVSEPSSGIQKSINKFEADVIQKKSEIQQKKSEIKSAASYIEDIEFLKGSFQELKAQSDGLSSKKYESDMEAEISDRMTRQARIAELDGDGLTLNANGRKSVENDIEAIRVKYDELLRDEKTAAAEKSGPKSESIKAKIKEFLSTLNTSRFEASSMADEGLKLTFGRFSGKTGSEGWPYTATFTVSGNKVFEYTGLLLYTEISGKSVPSPAKVGDPDYDAKNETYNKYLDAVDIFDALLRENSFIEAVLAYTVTPSADSTEYKFTATSLKFNNVLTDKTVKTLRKTESIIYKPQPEIKVDLDLSTQKSEEKAPAATTQPSAEVIADTGVFNPFEAEPAPVEPKPAEIKPAVVPVEVIEPVAPAEPKPEEPAQEEKKPAIRITIVTDPKTPEKAPEEPHSSNLGPSIRTKNPDAVRAKDEKKKETKQKATKVSWNDDGKTTYSAILYFLPGTINFYNTGNETTMSLGYELDFALLNHLYAGFKFESNILKVDLDKASYYDGTDESLAISDTEDPLVLTGVLGINYNLTKNTRLSLYGEAGLVMGDICAGAGISLEFLSPSTNSGFFVGYTALAGESEKIYNKFTLGFEQSF